MDDCDERMWSERQVKLIACLGSTLRRLPRVKKLKFHGPNMKLSGLTGEYLLTVNIYYVIWCCCPPYPTLDETHPIDFRLYSPIGHRHTLIPTYHSTTMPLQILLVEYLTTIQAHLYAPYQYYCVHRGSLEQYLHTPTSPLPATLPLNRAVPPWQSW